MAEAAALAQPDPVAASGQLALAKSRWATGQQLRDRSLANRCYNSDT